jgi:hypothetical protein
LQVYGKPLLGCLFSVTSVASVVKSFQCVIFPWTRCEGVTYT